MDMPLINKLAEYCRATLGNRLDSSELGNEFLTISSGITSGKRGCDAFSATLHVVVHRLMRKENYLPSRNLR